MSDIPFPRRLLGDTFKQLRDKRDWTKNRAATELGVSRDKLNAIEESATRLSIMDIRGLCSTYGASQELEHELIALADSRQKDGWLETSRDGVPKFPFKLHSMEQRAKELLIYESEYMTGLFQTADYLRANQAQERLLLEQPEWGEKVLEERLARWERMKQKEIPPRVRVILNEPVLMREIGCPEVMEAQIAYLREVNQLPFVDISVLPLAAGPHPSMPGAYMVLAFDNTEPDVVFLESRDGGRYVSSPMVVALYRGDFFETDTLTKPLEEFVK
ncbi:helix-turn-helix domain-containing protein [Stackebrandtia nassauensis]|uniref:DUF5753 domain-containing protein n=1 Tax=Stackebrandtia nassauensis (strain DSM 44728 / CIP 108903 / NRRL B-16338 / NBRC 102104 / LLR-40K-21) TaxID=446470 RepID=D3Q0P9_STANL|nr:helix-turn-helix transcriptional regulator [Stackebrandtia nassauensis]ADD41785.1 hypothetical protein Snas_2091 [Stackebrandtia nassauensis DSM 44728]